MSEPQAQTTDDQAPTPGPWLVNKYGSIGAGQYGTLPIVAYVESLEGSDRKYGNHGANARLIAAAPELLALVKSYLYNYGSTNQLSERTRDIIAKVEGRS